MAIVLAFQCYLHVPLVRSSAQEVVTDETVEVVRGRRPRVNLRSDDLGNRPQRVRHLRERAVGRLERRSLGKIDHHLELVLVVEGEHLDAHQAERHERKSDQQKPHDPREENEPGPAASLRDERRHRAAVEARERPPLRLPAAVRARRHVPEEQARRPGRDGEGDKQGKQHRGRSSDRDGAHVGAHEPSDESHRHDRRDDGEGREDRRVADLVGRLHRDGGERAAAGAGQPQVPHDVLDDDDRVVHEDSDREDQGEERDAVQRVAEKREHEERQRERHRDRQENDAGLATPERQGHEQRHRKCREAHVFQELVGLLRGGLAIVARDGRSHVGGEELAAQGFELPLDGAHDGDGVGAAALGNRERHGRPPAVDSRLAVGHVSGGFFGAIHHPRDIREPDRAPGALRHDNGGEIRGRTQEPARLDQDLPAVRNERPRLLPAVGRGNGGKNGPGSEAARGETRRVELHAEFAAKAADQGRIRDLGNRLDLVLDFGRDLPQRGGVLRAAPEGQRPDRDVVDRPGLDEGRGEVAWPPIGDRVDPSAHAKEGPVRVLADPETDDKESAAGRRRRIDVFDAGNGPELLLERRDDLPLDLDDAPARHRGEDVDHRHLDLRLLLARGHYDRERSEREREEDEERRQLRLDEGSRQAPRDSRRPALGARARSRV